MGHAIDVTQRAATFGSTDQNGNLALNAGLAVCTLHSLAVDVFAPVGDFAQRIRHDFHGPELKGVIDFLSRGEPFAMPVTS